MKQILRFWLFGFMLACDAGCMTQDEKADRVDRTRAQLEDTPAAFAALQEEVTTLQRERERIAREAQVNRQALSDVLREVREARTQAQSERQKLSDLISERAQLARETELIQEQVTSMSDRERSVEEHLLRVREEHADSVRTQVHEARQELRELREQIAAYDALVIDRSHPPHPTSARMTESRTASLQLRDDLRRQFVGYKLIELDGRSTNGLGHILKRATAMGGYHTMLQSTEPSGRDVYVRIWADPQTRRAYYKTE